MSKRVTFSARPPTTVPSDPAAAIADPVAIDAWVNNEKAPITEPVKRFTFEVPLSLHKRIKMRCAEQDRQMADVIRELLDKHFPAK
jgi:hypothetical protein